jgi:UDP-N-acetylmuramyl pentapeptide synthase
MVKLPHMNRTNSLEKNVIRAPVTLRTLFTEFPFAFSPAQIPDVSITGIAIDSRKVEPGNLFVAIKGSSADGHTFITEAIARGARAIVCEREMTGLSIPVANLAGSSLLWQPRPEADRNWRHRDRRKDHHLQPYIPNLAISRLQNRIDING